jgi:hypothetical protein
MKIKSGHILGIYYLFIYYYATSWKVASSIPVTSLNFVD